MHWIFFNKTSFSPYRCLKQTKNQPDPLVEQHKKGCGYVMISADFNGAIKVFINKTKPKHSSLPYTAIAD